MSAISHSQACCLKLDYWIGHKIRSEKISHGVKLLPASSYCGIISTIWRTIKIIVTKSIVGNIIILVPYVLYANTSFEWRVTWVIRRPFRPKKKRELLRVAINAIIIAMKVHGTSIQRKCNVNAKENAMSNKFKLIEMINHIVKK